MYNKIFTKILDSSIWLEDTDTRIVWITLLAQMDEDGYAHFSAIGNLANRAQVSNEAAEKAVKVLLSPDPDSGDPENDGRRIERVPGGYIVLNAPKYRKVVKRELEKEQNRARVKTFREKNKKPPVAAEKPALPPGNGEDKSEKTPKKTTPAKQPDTAITGDVWAAYSDAYFNRYNTEPVRNAKVNSQLSQFIQRIGKDEAPGVAAFYVLNNNAFYVARGHAIGQLLADAEKLRTEWATQRQVTQTQAGQGDKRSATQQVFQKLIDKAD